MLRKEQNEFWWNETATECELITGVYQGLKWSELPEHAKIAARKFFVETWASYDIDE